MSVSQVASVEAARQACQRLLAMLEQAQRVAQQTAATPDDRVGEPLALLAASLLRMRVLPALGDQYWQLDPPHVVMLGTTNSGKSTVLNILLGGAAAGMNVLARYTQHPMAFRSTVMGQQWLDRFPSRFAEYQRFENSRPPLQTSADLNRNGYRRAIAILDPEEVAQPRLIEPTSRQVVWWDAPDFSTEEAQLWMGTVLDVVALADVVVLVVTDQSYADDRGLLLWRLMSSTGVTLRVVANKLPNSPALLHDITEKLQEHWCGPRQGWSGNKISRLPLLAGGDPIQLLTQLIATPEALQVRKDLAQELQAGKLLKQKALRGAVDFWETRWDDLVRPLQLEAQHATRWDKLVVEATESHLLKPYQQEYLDGQKYAEFNLALQSLLEKLELPVIGQAMEAMRWTVRLPFDMLSRWWTQKGDQPVVPAEREKLNQLLERWQTQLRDLAREEYERSRHPGWKSLADTLLVREPAPHWKLDFDLAYAEYRRQLQAEIEHNAEEIHAFLSRNPLLLHTLQTVKAGINLASLALIVVQGGINVWDLVIAPVVASVQQEGVRLAVQQHVERQQGLLKQRQLQLFRELAVKHLQRPVGLLFPSQVNPAEVDRWREDLICVHRAIYRLAAEAPV